MAPQDTEDNKQLGSAMGKIESVVAIVNEKKREDEEINKLYELQLKFVLEKVE